MVAQRARGVIMTRLQIRACVTGASAPRRGIRKSTAALIAIAVLTVCSFWHAFTMYELAHPRGITLRAAPAPGTVPQDPGSWI